MQFGWIEVLIRHNGIECNDSLHLFRGSYNHQCRDAEILEDLLLDSIGEIGSLQSAALEHDVPALDVGCYLLQAHTRERIAQLVHLDPVVAADVDAAQHGDVNGHGLGTADFSEHCFSAGSGGGRNVGRTAMPGLVAEKCKRNCFFRCTGNTELVGHTDGYP